MVTGAYHPEVSSSAIQCRDTARALDGRARVRVLTTAVDPALPREDIVDDVKVSRVHIDVGRVTSKLHATGDLLASLARLLPQSDIVHIHGCSTKNVPVTAAARLYKRPVVLSLHTAGFDEAPAVRAQGRLAWWAYSHADHYLAVSPGLMEAFIRSGLPASRIELAPNGIDTDRFRPADASERAALRRRLGLPPDRPIVLFVGFFSHDKQPRVLFEAWRQVRQSTGLDVTLVFVGATRSQYFEVDDDLSRTLQAEARALEVSDRVRFVGQTPEPQDYYRAADVFVLTSRREGLPVALLEAMACGQPCVSSRLPGSTDTIIDDGLNGLLVDVGDVAGFAGAIGRVLKDRSLASRLATAGRETVFERYAISQTASRWLGAYDRVLNDRGFR